MKFDYMQKLGSGCFGIVYPLEAGKVIKFGKIEADREFFELHAAKAGVSLFPTYYGTKDDVIYEERVKGQINTEVGTGIVVQQLKQTFSQAVGEGRIPFKVLEDKLYELEEKLFRFSVETGIILMPENFLLESTASMPKFLLVAQPIPKKVVLLLQK